MDLADHKDAVGRRLPKAGSQSGKKIAQSAVARWEGDVPHWDWDVPIHQLKYSTPDAHGLPIATCRDKLDCGLFRAFRQKTFHALP